MHVYKQIEKEMLDIKHYHSQIHHHPQASTCSFYITDKQLNTSFNSDASQCTNNQVSEALLKKS